ncbi:hypothetical protein [Micromonospora sp. NPDC003816]|uniref:hypothetical protein n=1 Tax=Micromonospora sp. NPDC003816 TaxID=3364224 RepID=UPI00367742AC
MQVTPLVHRARWSDIDWIVDLVTATLAPTATGAWLVPDPRRRPAVLAAVARIRFEHAPPARLDRVVDVGSRAGIAAHRAMPLPAADAPLVR